MTWPIAIALLTVVLPVIGYFVRAWHTDVKLKVAEVKRVADRLESINYHKIELLEKDIHDIEVEFSERIIRLEFKLIQLTKGSRDDGDLR